MFKGLFEINSSEENKYGIGFFLCDRCEWIRWFLCEIG